MCKYNIKMRVAWLMETLVVFLNVQLKISLRIGNLQMLPEIGLFKKKKRKRKRKERKKKIKWKKSKSGLSQFLFLQQKI